MGRPRTGTWEIRNGTIHTRITVGVGKDARRELYDLGTADENLAKQRLAHLLKQTAKKPAAAAPSREELKREVLKAETFEAFSVRFVEKRKAQGIVSARDEENNLRRYVWPFIGDKQLVEGGIRSSHIEAMLDAAVAAGRGQETLRKIRAATNRVFKAALRAENTQLKTNPVTNTDVPKLKGGRRKQRAIPTDAELVMYFSCPVVDDELQMMVLTARVEGGMRTGDVIRWDWIDIDTETFATCTVPRSKTDTPQELSIPPMLAMHLRARWHSAGKPTTGPVFPVQRGPRKGQMRAKRGISFAARFRRDLKRAGVLRRELFVSTERTLPVDFHSLRRAFVTKLATAGINVQKAMALANHTDQRTHMLYVGADPDFREIPASVVADLSFGSVAKTPLLSVKNPRATQDSNLRPSAPEAVVPVDNSTQLFLWNTPGGARLRRNRGAGERFGFGTTGAKTPAPDEVHEATLRWLRTSLGGVNAQASWWETADALVLSGEEMDA